MASLNNSDDLTGELTITLSDFHE
ncbi:hypothetical protein CCACVL1_29800 [Corchorus capsularis]|uniref:Uncharacterized protein n=1 Tax=Corchorus capsularis TaxID=210143 RepID=A0A1R3G022_COCAP|nr:hypothetical protein CCACVL1_29800 [Corchorus capsularis]